MDIVRREGYGTGSCACLQVIGSIALHERWVDRVVRLFAARARGRESALAEDWLVPMVRNRERLLARLGEEAFAASWNAGWVLTPDQATTLAGDILGAGAATSSA